ncbi:hypothetical protein HCH_05343 [Hahella chejuensis KCTC 2396]|uniref:Uncharacterized protein n=1 Tax=Hahella chejuensis (strain KCTC 2396) TaxID=349521 RepID=Q2SBF8_HAHCH|nr:hypothetical protein HCH_05343 [Hahella chejuensis KCTC 2396]
MLAGIEITDNKKGPRTKVALGPLTWLRELYTK